MLLGDTHQKIDDLEVEACNFPLLNVDIFVPSKYMLMITINGYFNYI